MRRGGFSLLEMMTVVAIAGVLAALAVPNILGMVRRTKASGEASTLVATINAARAQAMTRGFPSVVCVDPPNASVQAYQKGAAILPPATVTASIAKWVTGVDSSLDRQLIGDNTSLTLPSGWTAPVHLVFDSTGQVYPFYGATDCASDPPSAVTVIPPPTPPYFTFRVSSVNPAIYREFELRADGPARLAP